MIRLFHSKRRWQVQRVESPAELAEKLIEHTWSLCTAFSIGGYFFFNDATSEDGAQEYAVVKPVGEEFFQLESITFSWTTRAKALALIEQALTGAFDREALYGKVELPGRLDSHEEHGRCRFCE